MKCSVYEMSIYEMSIYEMSFYEITQHLKGYYALQDSLDPPPLMPPVCIFSIVSTPRIK